MILLKKPEILDYIVGYVLIYRKTAIYISFEIVSNDANDYIFVRFKDKLTSLKKMHKKI